MTLNNIKVGSRLALAFGLILFIMAVISVIGIWRLQGLADTDPAAGHRRQRETQDGRAVAPDH